MSFDKTEQRHLLRVYDFQTFEVIRDFVTAQAVLKHLFERVANLLLVFRKTGQVKWRYR